MKKQDDKMEFPEEDAIETRNKEKLNAKEMLNKKNLSSFELDLIMNDP
jgi:hypothetical protein